MKKEGFLSFILFLGTLLYGQEQFDTLFETEDLHVRISKTESTVFSPYFENTSDISHISSKFDNFHRRSLAIEKYQIAFYKLNITIDSLDRIVALQNGKILRLSPDESNDEHGYTLEKWFKKYNFLLFRVQWFEGNNYFLLNTLTGEKTYVGGRVYFNPNGKFLLSVEDDIDANYCFNGFQLFSVGNKGQLKKVWEYSPVWGPSHIKWIDNNRFVTKGYIYDRDWKIKTFFKDVEFNIPAKK